MAVVSPETHRMRMDDRPLVYDLTRGAAGYDRWVSALAVATTARAEPMRKPGMTNDGQR
jgi:hypothetical protein